MTEIDVEKASGLFLHHVITSMSITYSKNISSSTLTCSAFYEVLMILLSIHCHLLSFFPAAPFFLYVFQNGVLLVRAGPVAPLTVLFVYPRELFGVVDELNVADHVPRLDHTIRNHLHVKAVLHPQTVHQLEQLQHQVVLSQIISILEHHCDFVHALSLVEGDTRKEIVAEDKWFIGIYLRQLLLFLEF